MIEGAIFDMDGVLVDNARYHIRAWQQLGMELGKELAPDDIRGVFGQRNREMLSALIGRRFSEADSGRLAQRKEQIYRDLIAPEIKPVPGLMQFLADLKEQGFTAAVATSGPRENVELVLRSLGLESYWKAVVTGADVTRSKPAPDIFLLAARRLGLPAGRCVVFEDSTAGIEAAAGAGCCCIALSTTHTPEELQSCPVLRVVPDFTSLRAIDIKSMPA